MPEQGGGGNGLPGMEKTATQSVKLIYTRTSLPFII